MNRVIITTIHLTWNIQVFLSGFVTFKVTYSKVTREEGSLMAGDPGSGAIVVVMCGGGGGGAWPGGPELAAAPCCPGCGNCQKLALISFILFKITN